MFLGSPGVCPDPLNSTRRRQLNPHDAGSSRATQSISRSHAISSSCYVVIIMFPRMSNHPWLSEAARFNYGIFYSSMILWQCVLSIYYIFRGSACIPLCRRHYHAMVSVPFSAVASALPHACPMSHVQLCHISSVLTNVFLNCFQSASFCLLPALWTRSCLISPVSLC